jgi:hypothetical protein
MMQEELCGMQQAIEMMPRPDDEPFGEKLAECQSAFGEFCSWFALLKQEHEFHNLLQAFECRAAHLRKRAKNFSSMPPEEKGNMIEMSDKEFKMMQYELGHMHRAVDEMPRPDCESHRATLVGCQEEFAELCRLFASLKQAISDQEARGQEEEEQPRENWRLWRGPE